MEQYIPNAVIKVVDEELQWLFLALLMRKTLQYLLPFQLLPLKGKKYVFPLWHFTKPC